MLIAELIQALKTAVQTVQVVLLGCAAVYVS